MDSMKYDMLFGTQKHENRWTYKFFSIFYRSEGTAPNNFVIFLGFSLKSMWEKKSESNNLN